MTVLKENNNNNEKEKAKANVSNIDIKKKNL